MFEIGTSGSGGRERSGTGLEWGGCWSWRSTVAVVGTGKGKAGSKAMDSISN